MSYVFLSELDNYCKKIFSFLVYCDVPIRFNELLRVLNKSNFKISKPTLITHLKHLQNYEVINRKREGKQIVSYSVNDEKLDNLQFHKDLNRVAKNVQKSKETFNSFDVAEKIRYISFVLMIIELNRLKNEIRIVLEPNRKFEATLAFLSIQGYLDSFRQYLLQTCANSKDDAQKSLIAIENLEEKIRNEIFEI